jgi:hypothetical protein
LKGRDGVWRRQRGAHLERVFREVPEEKGVSSDPHSERDHVKRWKRNMLGGKTANAKALSIGYI